MVYFATIFDTNYLSRALALYDSINYHHKEFILYIFCLDKNVYNHLSKQKNKNVELIHLFDLEAYYPELLEIKCSRTSVDYIFTLSPYYPSYILEHNPRIPFICTLDVDQFFFSSSEEIFADLEEHSILIMPHKFAKNLIQKEVYGKYNVSFQVFKNDYCGLECLKLWRSQCFEWCEDRLANEKFADQKYLDNWKSIFGAKLKEISNPGFGLAAWNIENYQISFINNTVLVNGHRLVLFHYQGLRFGSQKLVYSGFNQYGIKSIRVITYKVFKPIIKQILKRSETSQKENLTRVAYVEKKGLFNKINSYGMFYILLNIPISMELVYCFNIKRMRINGLLNKFKNFYRSAR